MKRIILDTNFLLIPYQFKVDIFSEIRRVCSFSYGLAVIDRTLGELDIIAKEGGKSRLAVALALSMMKSKSIAVIKTENNREADDLILEIAGSDDIVATQDALFRKRLKEKRIPLISLRSKSHLELSEF